MTPAIQVITKETTITNQKTCVHTGAIPVKIGPYLVHLAREREITRDLAASVDYVVPLNNNLPSCYYGSVVKVIYSPLPDFGGVPEFWKAYLETIIDNALKKSKKLLVWCTGSHGRTGCWAASMISLLEPETEDPIAAIRERHCKHAVETIEQAKAVFAVRGLALPEKYVKEFTKPVSSWSNKAYDIEIPEDCVDIPTVKIYASVFVASADGSCFTWKPCHGTLAPKFLQIAGVTPTQEEYELFLHNTEYHGFRTTIKPKTEVAFKHEHFEFIESDDKQYLVNKVPTTADRYFLNIDTEFPTKEDTRRFMNDSHIIGFHRVKPGEKKRRSTPDKAVRDLLSGVIHQHLVAYEIIDPSEFTIDEVGGEVDDEVYVEIEGEHTFTVEERVEEGKTWVYLTGFHHIGEEDISSDEFFKLPYLQLAHKLSDFSWQKFVHEKRFKGFKIAGKLNYV